MEKQDLSTAARIAWAAEEAKLPEKMWRPTFRLAVGAALSALHALVEEALESNALRPGTFCELDELTRSPNVAERARDALVADYEN